MKVRLLLDENMEVQVRAALLRRERHIDVLRVGDQTAPPLRAPDPAILLYVEEQQRMLVTRNRASMPEHVADHLGAGRHHWGVMRVRKRGTIAALVETLLLAAQP
ncbi:MAG: DUF5615 family PIN-like protein [Chloroflexi bacterium]|nr:DUF5615 family PIN-like protein [Chloroflexota bacterium]